MVGRALDEVLGPIHGVHGEGVVGGEVALEQAGVGAVRLLTEHDDVGVCRGQRRRDRHLRLPVGHGDQVPGVLLHDLVLGQGSKARSDEVGGDLLEQGEDRVGRQAGHGTYALTSRG